MSDSNLLTDEERKELETRWYNDALDEDDFEMLLIAHDTLVALLAEAEQKRDIATEQRDNHLRRLTQERADHKSLRSSLSRAVFLAQHLFEMVPRDVWREHGVEHMGHYEGDYHAEQVQEELKGLAALSDTQREDE